MAESVGVIYYEVEADTSKLLNSVTPADQSLDRLQKTFDRTDKAANQANFQLTKTAEAVKGLGRESQVAASSLGGLTKLLGGYLTLQGANTLIQMAEGYREMGERIRFATSSQEEYEMVQQRLLATANGTYRALSEAQEAYILTADSLRSMGYSTEQALDITDSLSYAFVKNATSADRGANATRAFSNAIMKGKVEADGWSTIISAVPSIIQDIADAAGLSAEEVRKMGAEGKLTAQIMSEGFLQSLGSSKAAADGMATTVRDAFNNMRNSLSAYLGESHSASTATGLLSNAVLLLGNNIETVVGVLTALGAGALAKYIAQTGATAAQSGRAMLASRDQAISAVASAKATEAAALAELQRARTLSLTAGGLASATAAERNYQAAVAATAVAQRGAASVGAMMLGVLGGPVGIIAMLTTAAVGMYAFRDGSDEARKTLDAMAKPMDEIIDRFRRLSEAQRAEAVVKNIKAQALAADESEASFRKLYNSISSVNILRTDWSRSQWQAFREEIMSAKKAGEDLTPIIQRAAAESGLDKEAIYSWLELNGELDRAKERLANAKDVSEQLAAEAARLAGATRDAASGQRELNDALAGFTGTTGDALKKMQERVAAMQDGNSEVKKAQRYLEGLTDVSDEFKNAYLSAAYALDANAEAQRKANASKKTGTSAAQEQKKAEEENAKAIAAMAESLYQAGLSGEALAVAKARASLNSFATQSEVEQLEALARALYKVEEADRQRQKFGTGSAADQFIMGSTSPLSGGAFDDQYARYEAEARVEQERYAAQLQRLKEARELQIETSKSYDALAEQAARDHAMRMQQIEDAKTQVLLASGQDLFGALADAVKTYAGESSGAYKAMFAVSKAFAIAQATLNLSTAISQAMADPSALTPSQKFANMAAIAAAGGQLVSSISGATFGGGRQNGGGVSAGKFYRINETGAPEILNTNGKQYLMMNQSSGRVTPMQSGGAGSAGGGVNVYIDIQSDGSTQTRAPEGLDQFGRTIGEFVRAEFQKLQIQSNRPGGMNWRQRNGGGS